MGTMEPLNNLARALRNSYTADDNWQNDIEVLRNEILKMERMIGDIMITVNESEADAMMKAREKGTPDGQ